MGSGERTQETVSTTDTAPVTTGISKTAGLGAGQNSTPDAGRSGTEDQGGSSGPLASKSEVEKISISCLMNAHYHAGREAFLDTVHRWFMFGVIAVGATALIDVFPSEKKELLKTLCSAAAALLGALDLTFDLSNRARMHSMMKRRYFDIMADVREGMKTPHDARVCLERYSGDEEPPYRVLLLACWNLAQAGVYGFKAQKFIIPRWALITKNFFRRPGVIYPVKSAEPNPTAL